MLRVSGDLDLAVALLRAGELVAFPTETVYGLGADAGNEGALEKLFILKGRPRQHPLIVHLADARQAPAWASGFGRLAEQLAAAFWPGPLTLILPAAPHVSPLLTGGQPTVALRVPSHPVARELLGRFGGGLAAPSANRFGHVSPTRSSHVAREFGEGLSLILEGGDCAIGIESTIVAVLDGSLELLRPGHISRPAIEAATGQRCLDAQGRIRAPGSLHRHYAPATPARLLAAGEILVAVRDRAGQGCAVLSRTLARPAGTQAAWLEIGADPASYAHQLYDALRELDDQRANCLLIEQPPVGDDWLAIRDRLRRACGPDA